MGELAKDYGPDTPDAEVARRNWFRRCVYESDNDVCDGQFATVTWDDDVLPPPVSPPSPAASEGNSAADAMGARGSKTATFHMAAQTKRQCERYTNLFGVHGEIYADSSTIQAEDFRTGLTTTHHPPTKGKGHYGGGDIGLARQFVLAIDKVKNHGWITTKAQKELIGCTLEEDVRSHAMVFCAEEASHGQKVVDWAGWLGQKTRQ